MTHVTVEPYSEVLMSWESSEIYRRNLFDEYFIHFLLTEICMNGLRLADYFLKWPV